MPLLKHFWIYATLLIVLVITVLASAIWGSADSSPVTSAGVMTGIHGTEEKTATELTTEKPVPSHFPRTVKSPGY